MALYRPVDDLLQIARNGGGIEIDAGRYPPDDLLQIVRNLSDGANLKLVNSDRLTQQDILQIARNGKGKVTFG